MTDVERKSNNSDKNGRVVNVKHLMRFYFIIQNLVKICLNMNFLFLFSRNLFSVR